MSQMKWHSSDRVSSWKDRKSRDAVQMHWNPLAQTCAMEAIWLFMAECLGYSVLRVGSWSQYGSDIHEGHIETCEEGSLRDSAVSLFGNLETDTDLLQEVVHECEMVSVTLATMT